MANEKKTNTMPTIKCPECDICGEKRWARVKCRYCDFECCAQCFDTYLLSTPGDSKCMSCKAIYDTDTIFQLCGTRKKTFKEYEDFKIQQIIQREKSLFQETLVEIEREREQKKLQKYHQVQYSIEKAQELLNKFQMTVLDIAKTDEAIAESMISKVGMSLKYIKNLRCTKLLDASQEVRKILNGQTPEEKKEEMKRNTFIKNCSMPNCKGTLNNRWNCRLCETSHCSKCGEKKEGAEAGEETKDAHVCDPNMVQSMEEIKKNSKPCPKCGVSIFKTEGCDQMFCIVCHTAFSWTTLQIETGRIHNPHYYEILRKNGNIRREEGDVRPCDELVYIHHYFDQLSMLRANSSLIREQCNKIEETFRFVTELNDLHNERRFVIDNHTFLEIRKKYLLNQVKDSQFKTNIKRKNTEITKNFERCQVLGVTKIALSEELKKLFRKENGERLTRFDFVTPEFLLNHTTFEKNVNSIIQNTNDILERLSSKYTTSAPHKKIYFLHGMYQVVGEEALAKHFERLNNERLNNERLNNERLNNRK